MSLAVAPDLFQERWHFSTGMVASFPVGICGHTGLAAWNPAGIGRLS